MRNSWLYGALGLLIIVFGSMLALYLHLHGQQRTVIERGEELALRHTQIREITSIEEYYGKEDYIVIEGKTEEGEKLVAWFHGEQGEVEKMSRLIPRENIMETLAKEHPGMQLIHLIPAKQDNKKAWEALFVEGKYLNYYYLDVYNGKFLKSYRLQRTDS
jgi:uncharacterized protein YpmB